MNDPWLALILLALPASFLPLQFGLEIGLLGKEDGFKKGVGFTSGITLFRIVLVVGLGVLFTSFLALISSWVGNISTGMQSTFHQLSLGLTSGEHVMFDVLLIMAGAALWIKVVQHMRNRSKANQSAQSDSSPKKTHSKGAIGFLIIGFTWVSISVNQWIFMTASIGQVFSLSDSALGRTLIYILFFLLASLMLLLPLLYNLLRPTSAPAALEKINYWLNGAMPYVVLILMFVIGLHFIINGTTGVRNFLTRQ